MSIETIEKPVKRDTAETKKAKSFLKFIKNFDKEEWEKVEHIYEKNSFIIKDRFDHYISKNVEKKFLEEENSEQKIKANEDAIKKLIQTNLKTFKVKDLEENKNINEIIYISTYSLYVGANDKVVLRPFKV